MIGSPSQNTGCQRREKKARRYGMWGRAVPSIFDRGLDSGEGKIYWVKISFL